MDRSTSRLTGNPAGLSGRRRDAAIQACRQFELHEGPTALENAQETAVLLATPVFQQADPHLDTRPAQGAQTAPGDLGVRIAVPHEDAFHAGFQQTVGTGAGATCVRTGLQGHGHGGAAQ